MCHLVIQILQTAAAAENRALVDSTRIVYTVWRRVNFASGDKPKNERLIRYTGGPLTPVIPAFKCMVECTGIFEPFSLI